MPIAPSRDGVRRSLAVAALLALLIASPARAQYFGQNKVQYEKFDFLVLKTAHFDIYYYAEEAAVTPDVAQMAERWYARIARVLGHELRGRQPVILYASHPHFAQTNVIEGFIDEGTGGVTEGQMRRVTLPLGATLGETDHVLGHELVHAFQYDILGRGGENLPLWFIEGMAEYLSIGPRDAQTAMWLRDAVVEKKVPSIKKLDDPKYFPYRYGHAFWAYIGGHWGDETIGRILRDVAVEGAPAAGDPIKAIEDATEKKIDVLSTEWQAAIEATARPTISQAAAPAGARIIGKGTGSGTLNVGPSLSPDGTRVAFLSARDRLSIDLYVADARTGEVGKLIGTATDPHFESLQFLASAGAWDPAGHLLAVAGVHRGRPVLAIVDVDSGHVTREIAFQDMGEIFQPAWSPDGKLVAFSAQAGGVTDLFVHDLDGNKTRRLTNDNFADLQPAWSPDGRRLAFVTDRFTSDRGTFSFHGYRLATITLATGEISALETGVDGNVTNPQWSSDGSALFFLSDHGGRQNAWRLALATRMAVMVTNVPTGTAGITPLSPALSVSARGDVVSVSVFHDGGYDVAILNPGAEPPQPPPSSLDAARLPPVTRPTSTVAQLLEQPAAGLPEARPSETRPYSPRLKLLGAGQQVGVATGSAFGTYATGGVSFLFSDTLGNHLLGTGVSINGGVRDLATQLEYINRTSRWNWGLFVDRTPLLSGTAQEGLAIQNGTPVIVDRVDLFRQTYNQVGAQTAYPFDRATRIEFRGGVQQISFSHEVQTQQFSAITGQLISDDRVDLAHPASLKLFDVSSAIVRDTSAMGATSPVRGQRARLEFAPTFGDLHLTNITADYRHYVMPFRPVTVAGRLMHIGRYGTDAEDSRLFPLFLGYPEFVRGYGASSFQARECTPTPTGTCPEFDRLFGSRLLVVNGEVRAPLVGLFTGKLSYGPVPVELFGFVDSGQAWNAGTRGSLRDNWITSAGAGLRVNLFGFAIAELNLARPIGRPLQGWMFVFNLRPGF